MIDYRYLKAFLTTVECKSFSAAARELRVAQSAISRQIKLLEESIGEELLIRSPKSLLLTEKGSELYETLQRFDRSVEQIFASDEMALLRIGILEGLLDHWLVPLIIRFYSKKKNISIKVSMDSPSELKNQLERGELDVIFTTDNIQTDMISSLKLFKEKLVLISKRSIDRRKLNQERWIIFSSDDNIFKMTKRPSENFIEVSSFEAILKLVNAGLGVAVVPDHVLPKKSKLEVSPVPELGKSRIYMATLNYKKLPETIKEFTNVPQDFWYS